MNATMKPCTTPLLTMEQADAMVAAERERLITRLRQIGMYECGCAQDAQHCEELADQLAMEHTGADWPDWRQADGPNEWKGLPRPE